MQLIIADIERLKPYESNPRLITEEDINKLVDVIKASGFLDPIEVDADWEIVVGHRRWHAAKKMGLARVPVIHHDGMTKEEARLYRISNNKVGEDVKWNRALLTDELTSIEHLIEGPADLGFSNDEMMKLFDLDRGADDDEASEGEKEDTEPGPYVQAGQVWNIGPCAFTVFSNLNKEQMRKAEAAIIKIQKLLKEPATLSGSGTTLKEYLAEAQRGGIVT